MSRRDELSTVVKAIVVDRTTALDIVRDRIDADLSTMVEAVDGLTKLFAHYVKEGQEKDARIKELQESCAEKVRGLGKVESEYDALVAERTNLRIDLSRAKAELARINLNKHEANKTAAIRWEMGKPEVHAITPYVQDGRWVNTVSKSRWNGDHWQTVGQVQGWIESFDGEIPDSMADGCVVEEVARRRFQKNLNPATPDPHLAKLDEILVAVKELGNG